MSKALAKNHLFQLMTVLLFTACIVFGGGVLADQVERYNNSNMARSLSETVSIMRSEGGFKGDEIAALNSFYVLRGSQPYWIKGDSDYNKINLFLSTLDDAWTHGLNPERYHVGRIRTHLNEQSHISSARAELLLTAAFMRYARDLSGKRIDSSALRMRAEDWVRPLNAEEAVNLLTTNSGSFEQLLAGLFPQSKLYDAMRKALIALVNEHDFVEGDLAEPIRPGGLLKPGWSHKSVKTIKARLDVDYSMDPYLYDAALEAAVTEFQKQNRLNADGVIGPSTLAALNTTREDKIHALIANMERLRWLPDDLGRRYVLVNIPSSRLWAIENGKVALDMKVIVGSPWRQTRSFVTEIKGVRLNPTWTIPPTIKRHDILPKVREDKTFLEERNIGIYKGYGRNRVSIDPGSIDWNALSWHEARGYQLVQAPGENNPLGRYRVLMPNPYSIYLHDTNHPELFDQTERALSSGCVRVSDPEKLSDFIMKGHRDWNRRRHHEILASLEKTDLELDHTIPVYLLYQTIWQDDQGGLIYGQDIYKRDRDLIEALAAIDGFKIPRHNKVEMAAIQANI